VICLTTGETFYVGRSPYHHCNLATNIKENFRISTLAFQIAVFLRPKFVDTDILVATFWPRKVKDDYPIGRIFWLISFGPYLTQKIFPATSSRESDHEVSVAATLSVRIHRFA
jgi:hypothetical protein